MHNVVLHYIPTADDNSLYTLVCECIHPGIIHRAKTKSKYNVAQQSHYLTRQKIWVPIQDSHNTEGSTCNIFQRPKTVDLQHNRQPVPTNANDQKPSSNIQKGSITDVAGIVGMSPNVIFNIFTQFKNIILKTKIDYYRFYSNA